MATLGVVVCLYIPRAIASYENEIRVGKITVFAPLHASRPVFIFAMTSFVCMVFFFILAAARGNEALRTRERGGNCDFVF